MKRFCYKNGTLVREEEIEQPAIKEEPTIEERLTALEKKVFA